MASKDFVHWKDDELVLEPDTLDQPGYGVLRAFAVSLRQPMPRLPAGASYLLMCSWFPAGMGAHGIEACIAGYFYRWVRQEWL